MLRDICACNQDVACLATQYGSAVARIGHRSIICSVLGHHQHIGNEYATFNGRKGENQALVEDNLDSYKEIML